MRSGQARSQTLFSYDGYFIGRTILSRTGVPRDVGNDCHCFLASCSYLGDDLGYLAGYDCTVIWEGVLIERFILKVFRL